MSQENVEIVRTLFDAFARRDHEAAFAYYDAEIEWDTSRVREGADVDTAGVYHGRRRRSGLLATLAVGMGGRRSNGG